MAQRTDLGLLASTEQEIQDRHNANWRSAYGQDLTLGTETPAGQLAGLDTEADIQIDEVLIHVGNGMDLNSAVGSQVDAWGTLYDIERLPGALSAATVTFIGTPATVIPALTQVGSTAGDTFATLASVTIGAAQPGQTEGTVDATVQALVAGPVAVDVDTITRLLTAPVGVTAVNNAADGLLGEFGESDTTYKRRMRAQTAGSAAGHVDAITAAFVRQDTVHSATVRDNATAAALNIQGIAVPANATVASVRWAVGIAGSAALFNAIMDLVHPRGMPRLYVAAVSLDVIIVVDTTGLSQPAAAAARAAITARFTTLGPGDVVTNSDLLFEAKLAVERLGENREGVTAITITPPTNRDVEAKRDAMNTTGVTLGEYLVLAAIS